jgi:transcription initiation factor TFIIIB Brf1 subunit/transcription initiation factor TFIIB
MCHIKNTEEYRSQLDIAGEADIREVPIRNRLKEITSKLDLN